MAYQVAVAKTHPVGVGKADTRQSGLAMLYRYAQKFMTEERFWEIIHNSLDRSQQQYGKERFGNIAVQLPLHVQDLDNEELLEFYQLYREKSNQLYDGVLWSAAILVWGAREDKIKFYYLGNDSFMDFRDSLAAQGRETYERFLNDPDSLVEFQAPLDFGEDYIGSGVGGALEDRGISLPDVSLGEILRPYPEWDDIGFFRAFLPKIFHFVERRDPGFWLGQTEKA